MKVPSKDYRRQHEPLMPELIAAFERVLLQDKPVLGAAVARFEQAFAAFHEVEQAIGVGSGTDAACLLYRALEVGPGDEVLTPARTFPGVISAILLAGATPRLVDADPETGGLSPEAVAQAWTPQTRGLTAVHLYGHPEAADELAAVCADQGGWLIEDVAQAHGARWRDRAVGGFGRAAITSFHPSKNLGAVGDGGAILTSDAALADRCRVLRNLGKADKYRFEAVGPNSKLDTLQAAILEVKLTHLPEWSARRQALAQRYLAGLAGLEAITLPRVSEEGVSAWHLFVIRTPQRSALKAALAEVGVQAGLHYPIPLRAHPAFAEALADQQTPVADQWAREVITLPLTHAHTEAEIDHVIETVRRWSR